MAQPAEVCPECGAARPSRAAGCPRCGHIFQDVPAAAAGLAPRPAARAGTAEPHPDDARGRSGAGCGSCLLLAGIVAGLTLLAALALWFFVRDDVADFTRFIVREKARADLVQVADEVVLWAEEHGRLPPDLEALELPAGALRDLWGESYRYELGPDGQSARLVSLGPDSAPGGEGGDADIERLVTLP